MSPARASPNLGGFPDDYLVEDHVGSPDIPDIRGRAKSSLTPALENVLTYRRWKASFTPPPTVASFELTEARPREIQRA